MKYAFLLPLLALPLSSGGAAADLAQDRFVALIMQARESVAEDAGAEAVQTALAERRSGQCYLTLEQSLTVKDWTGVVDSITPGEQGYDLTVAFADAALVTSVAPQAPEEGQGLALAVLEELSATDRVIYSGHFLPTEQGCLEEADGVEPEQALRQPTFLFVFTDLRKL